MKERAPWYAEAVVRHGGWVDRCIGFIDGTKLKIAHPFGDALLQRAGFSGYKIGQYLVFQTLTTQDGLILHIIGPVEGLLGDRYIYRYSEMYSWLRDYLAINGVKYYIYADQE